MQPTATATAVVCLLEASAKCGTITRDVVAAIFTATICHHHHLHRQLPLSSECVTRVRKRPCPPPLSHCRSTSPYYFTASLDSNCLLVGCEIAQGTVPPKRGSIATVPTLGNVCDSS
eukprot:7390583-Prymnesium_polylepis.2